MIPTKVTINSHAHNIPYFIGVKLASEFIIQKYVDLSKPDGK